MTPKHPKNQSSSDMQKFDFKKYFPFVGFIVVFIVMSLAYVSPVLEGKQLLQSDVVKFKGMAREVIEYREETGREALWTNTMFGGMPAFQISVKYANNISNYLHEIFTVGLPRPADMIFLYFAGFFIFMLLIGTSPWVAFLGAIAFAFSTYHFIIIGAGHNTKALAIAYMAPVFGSIIYTLRGNYLSGGILFSIFLALQLYSNHFQITYYLLFIVILYGLFEFYRQVREGKTINFLKASGVLVFAALIAVGVNISKIWSTYEYAEHTMRGGTELTSDLRIDRSGLDPAYITQWSYGIEETLSFLVPNVKGGASDALLLDELIAAQRGTATEQREAQAILEQHDPAFINFIIEGLQTGNPVNTYWGNQPFTSGPIYLGAIVMFLFVLSLFYVKGPIKWGFVIAIILSVLLSWGYNFQWFTDIFIKYIPGYSQFRAVTMILVIAEFCVPALAFIGLHQWYKNPALIKFKSTAFYTAVVSTAGLLVILYLLPNVFLTFLSEREMGLIAANASNPQLLVNFEELERVRISIFRADVLRSLIFIGLAIGVLALFVHKKINHTVFAVLLGSLILIDMWPVNKRYFDNTNFVSPRQVEVPFQPTAADLYILQDTTKHYRVFNRSVNTFNDSSTSWFHNSIGGYHGAKLQRYQELIDFHITQGNMSVLNMLNTRYFIMPGQDRVPQAVRNHEALGNAWFVSDILWVENADQELGALNDFNPKNTAIIDERFRELVTVGQIISDTLASIQLTYYQPNRLVYSTNNTTDQLAVFSEIFYPDGWKVHVDGNEAEQFRVNYVLRGMIVPAGTQEIEFRFEPVSFIVGERIALFSSLIMVVMIIVWIVKSGLNIWGKRKDTPPQQKS